MYPRGLWKRALPRAIAIPHLEGLGGIQHGVWGESTITDRPYASIGGTWVYPSRRMGRNVRQGPPPSQTERGLGVSGAGHGERAPPWAIPIMPSEGLRGIRPWA